jgi:glycosyltransferase involved in cell wall biosynthesis
VNVLIVTAGDITNPKEGAGNRTYHLAKGLKDAGNNVIVVQPKTRHKKGSQNGEFEAHRYLGLVGDREIFPFRDINPFFLFTIAKLLKRRHVDIVHVEYPWGIPAIRVIQWLIGKRQLLVYSSQNFQLAVSRANAQYRRTKKGLSLSETIITHFMVANTRIVEKLSVRLCDLVLSVSDDDKRAFMRAYGIGPDKIRVIPNGTSLQGAELASRDKTSFGLDASKFAVVFLGSYGYEPNIEAIHCIKNRIAPHFKRYCTKVEFVVAGYRVPLYRGDNLTCLGFVDDVHSLLKSCDIAVAPLTKGGGTRLKIFQYFAAGLPVVTTRKGIEGIDAMDQEHALIVNTTEELVEAVTFLVDHKQERERIGANAFKLVKSKYNWDDIGKSLNEDYVQLLRTPQSSSRRVQP